MAWAAAIPALIGAGASLLGGRKAASAQDEANRRNIELQLNQQRWEEKMSGSAYQRAVLDLQRAGLNPMLAYSQGGASTPSVSAATVQPVDAMGKAIASAGDKAAQGYALMKMKADAQYAQEKADQESMNTRAMKTSYLEEDPQFNKGARDLQKSIFELELQRGELTRQELENRVRKVEAAVEEQTEGAQVASAQAREQILRHEVDINEARKILLRLDIPEKKAMAQWFETVGAASPAAKAIMSISSWIKFILGGK